MSAIGSFYIFEDNLRDEIVAAAEAQTKALNKKRFGFLPPKLPLAHDPFWEFMRTKTEELDQYPYSGFLLLDLELLAPGTLGSKDAVGTKLSEITGATFISFRPDDATTAIKILDGADFSDEDIRKFLGEEGRGAEFPSIVTPIQNSVKHFKNWVSSVSQGMTGILNIG